MNNTKEVWRKARKRPIVISFREVESKELIETVWDKKIKDTKNLYGENIYTKEGREQAIVGKHFIIKGVKGELYPILKRIFYETYEVVK